MAILVLLSAISGCIDYTMHCFGTLKQLLFWCKN